ncbi:PepSY domain-containing protein [Marinilongibacter aquaticus]|uniref:PepSY-associated TM helix domain-containing protein n=1 Tax=Marinilongibacter aquaticus TaxID=2975157 RepID=UPI0021BDEA47|nr:PepSY-associated TM helix domain-containing protein [Marinilongibacter aquaticus]UBM59137.1 PepSY domain-containing protein [Marinilongibacter aquaticus]
MGNRIYNILFHTHTISGIFISALLYIIFFAGSLSFLRDEINAWERNEPIEADLFAQTDFDSMFKELEKGRSLYGRDVTVGQRYEEQRFTVSLSNSKDSTNTEKLGRRGGYFYVDAKNFQSRDYQENYSLGEFFYRLHFFAQFNVYKRSGYVLAGLVAFFFLFAVITGLVVHWDKIVQSFYVFRPKQKWKTVWTDAHVSLGLIGFPYQFVFALTGCFLIVGYSFMYPPVGRILFKDDQEKMNRVLEEEAEKEFEFKYAPLNGPQSINGFVEQTAERWPELHINSLKVYNYGDESMHVKVAGSTKYKEGLLGNGEQLFESKSGQLLTSKAPELGVSYVRGAQNWMLRLHYGDFAGYAGKVIYLILGFVTCFVIISGVLIWLTAREKKSVDQRKRAFNRGLVNIYMAICLSMFPAAAFCFNFTKIMGSGDLADRKAMINESFFWPWLLLILVFSALRNTYWTNKASLLLGAILSVCIPVSNGLITGNWLWISLQKGYSQIFVVDCFWLCTGLVAFLAFLKTKRRAA